MQRLEIQEPLTTDVGVAQQQSGLNKLRSLWVVGLASIIGILVYCGWKALGHFIPSDDTNASVTLTKNDLCGPRLSGVYHDLHDNNIKIVEVSTEFGLTIMPPVKPSKYYVAGVGTGWIVTPDNVGRIGFQCNVPDIDFRVPNKPSPPPGKVTAEFVSTSLMNIPWVQMCAGASVGTGTCGSAGTYPNLTSEESVFALIFGSFAKSDNVWVKIADLDKSCVPAEDASVGKDFYQFVNNAWLSDPSIVIPADYSSWGSFTELDDTSLKVQTKLLKELTAPANPDEEKLSAVWRASMAQLEGWEEGKGDYSEVLKEFEQLNQDLPELDADDDVYLRGLAKCLGRLQETGIDGPVAFDAIENLEDAESVILELSPSGKSLPSRDHYFDSAFEEQREWFKDHLMKVRNLIGEANLEEDFVNRVVRMETKLAQLQMTMDQERQFSLYFTVTTLDELCEDVNKMKYLEAKEANYADYKAGDADEDKVVLTSAKYTATADDIALTGKFIEELASSMGLRAQMAENYKLNYPSKIDAAEAQYRMIVFDGDYFRRLVRVLLPESNRQDVKAFLQYHIIAFAQTYCTKALNDEFFDFYKRKLWGQKEQETFERRTIGTINSWIGELMGKLYVSHYFSEEDKSRVHDMVKEILAIMENSLTRNDWLTEETKAKAKLKLSTFVVKLGYPDKWKSFDDLNINPDDSFFTMRQKVGIFKHKTEFLDKINSVKDKTRWEMNPQDVNAYYNPLNNEIVFPAAIMQPPFYHSKVELVDFALPGGPPSEEILKAINFGGMGAVIAHEITHGYDDQGREFDGDGNINDWWQEEDAKLFQEKCDLMAEQAVKWTYKDKGEGPLNDKTKIHTMNAKLTMGENLADLGGLSLANQACCGTKEQHVAFFYSWGNIWKEKQTVASIIQALASDPHAPDSFRCNLVKNVDAFYEAFDVQEGDAMYLPKDKRVQMW